MSLSEVMHYFALAVSFDSRLSWGQAKIVITAFMFRSVRLITYEEALSPTLLPPAPAWQGYTEIISDKRKAG